MAGVLFGPDQVSVVRCLPRPLQVEPGEPGEITSAPGIPPHPGLVKIDILVADAGLASSRGEARRLAQGGGLRVNDAPELDAHRTVTDADLIEGVVKLAAGKKKIVLVKPV